ncbi:MULTISPECIES: hypothetical protein [unclassified Streptomyces]|uniref:hypothetical protein n=1 Tax=unclassified Streptomyces TaxID=2593676 RepID=UPI0038124042
MVPADLLAAGEAGVQTGAGPGPPGRPGPQDRLPAGVRERGPAEGGGRPRRPVLPRPRAQERRPVGDGGARRVPETTASIWDGSLVAPGP